jgi:phosphatidylserine decarboxylase
MEKSAKMTMPMKARFMKSLGLLPQNMVSLAVGSLVRAKLPGALAKPLNKAFVSAFGINMAEAEKPIGDYLTIEDIFTRKLQAGSRSVAAGFVSPADGILERSEVTQEGHAIQAKGIKYCLREFVFGRSASIHNNSEYLPSWFTTVYLAPHNYHRVHAPCSGKVVGLRYIPGRLWPVNRPAVSAIPGLFCRNERLVFDVETSGGGKVWVVMVGAFNVGRMVTPLQKDFVSNAVSRQFSSVKPIEMSVSQEIAAGDEIGTFMLGSTVIVVFDKKAMEELTPRLVEAPVAVCMGQSLSL